MKPVVNIQAQQMNMSFKILKIKEWKQNNGVQFSVVLRDKFDKILCVNRLKDGERFDISQGFEIVPYYLRINNFREDLTYIDFEVYKNENGIWLGIGNGYGKIDEVEEILKYYAENKTVAS